MAPAPQRQTEIPMDERPLVSVIVIVRNGERFLAEALQSIRAQSYRPLEILVVDGHSTDRTAEIARAADVRYFLQPDAGISNAYNFGIAQARGALIAFLSHDDIWLPDKLTVQVAHLLAHPECQYAVCRIRYFLEPGLTHLPNIRAEWLQQEPIAYIMETLVARRTLFARIGWFAPELATAGDVDWFARVFDGREIGYPCDQVLVEKRIHDQNSSLIVSDSNKQLLLSMRRSLQRKRASALHMR